MTGWLAFRPRNAMSADSIPSQCTFCQLPYYRQGDFLVYTMSHFCLACRTKLTKKEWKLLGKFDTIFADIEYNSDYWELMRKLDIPSEEVSIFRVQFNKLIFESMATNVPRDLLFKTIQKYKVTELLNDHILDLVELFEEYDLIQQEKLNGQKRKTRTN